MAEKVTHTSLQLDSDCLQMKTFRYFREETQSSLIWMSRTQMKAQLVSEVVDALDAHGAVYVGGDR